MQSQARSSILIRLQIDELSPKRFSGLALIIILLIGIFFIISALLPQARMLIQDVSSASQPSFCIQNINQNSNSTANCAKPFNLQTYPIFMSRVQNVSGLNQLVYATVILEKAAIAASAISELTVSLQFSLSVYELSSANTISKQISSNPNHAISIHCSYNQTYCDETTILLIPELTYNNYLLLVQVLNAAQYTAQIQNAAFSVYTINAGYSNYLLGLRYTFMCVSTITCLLFIWRMKRLRSFRDWIYEQKAIFALGLLLIFFNNPIYALVIALPGEASFFFSTFFTVNFCIYLYGFWLTTYQRIRLENQQRNTKTLTIWKGIFLLLFWAFILTSLLLLNHAYLNDPGFDFDTEHQAAFLAFKILAIIFGVFALLWLLREVVYIIQTFKTRIWRQKILFVISSFFIVAFFIFIFAGAFSSFSTNGSMILLTIAFMNIYIYLLQLLYTPTDKGVREAQQIERIENHRPEMQYDVIEDNINIEFQSPYNDPGIHIQNDESQQPHHPHDMHQEEEGHNEKENQYSS